MSGQLPSDMSGQIPREEPDATSSATPHLDQGPDTTLPREGSGGEGSGSGPLHGRSRPMRRRRDGALGPAHHYGRWMAAVVVAGLASYLGVIHSTDSTQLAPVRTTTVAAPVSGTPTSATSTPTTSQATPSTTAAAVGQMAPNGTFTSMAGGTGTISSLRGRPLLVWFVAGGCASCAVSIPTVAQHLAQLQADQVTVVTLGLPDWFASGAKGLQELQFFGKTAAHRTVPTSQWIWGMPATALVRAYDPTGTPDVYTLVGPDGHIRYQNSVPASTMPQLLAAARHLDG